MIIHLHAAVVCGRVPPTFAVALEHKEVGPRVGQVEHGQELVELVTVAAALLWLVVAVAHAISLSR